MPSARIAAVETWITSTPFDMGAKPVAFGGMGWQAMNTLWLRVANDDGLEGWGEGFGHACVEATRAVIDAPLHPYTAGLLASLPRLDAPDAPLTPIRGQVPDPARLPSGCRFAARCPHRTTACDHPQQMRTIAPGRFVRCVLA